MNIVGQVRKIQKISIKKLLVNLKPIGSLSEEKQEVLMSGSTCFLKAKWRYLSEGISLPLQAYDISYCHRISRYFLMNFLTIGLGEGVWNSWGVVEPSQMRAYAVLCYSRVFRKICLQRYEYLKGPQVWSVYAPKFNKI